MTGPLPASVLSHLCGREGLIPSGAELGTGLWSSQVLPLGKITAQPSKQVYLDGPANTGHYDDPQNLSVGYFTFSQATPRDKGIEKTSGELRCRRGRPFPQKRPRK